MRGWAARQFALMALALQLLTRIPVRAGAPAPGDMARCLRYAPLVGVAVGGVAAAVLGAGFPPLVSAILAVGAMALMTGALHEDGLADTCDGLGARTPDDALRIMRDSRIGVFGALGLGLVTAARIAAIVSLPGIAVIGAAAISRFGMLLLPAILPPARPGGTGAPVAGGPGSLGWMIAGVTVLLAWWGLPRLLPALVIVVGAAWLLARHLRRRLGGYTGDTLGAMQQGGELLAYLVLLWRV